MSDWERKSSDSWSCKVVTVEWTLYVSLKDWRQRNWPLLNVTLTPILIGDCDFQWGWSTQELSRCLSMRSLFPCPLMWVRGVLMSGVGGGVLPLSCVFFFLCCSSFFTFPFHKILSTLQPFNQHRHPWPPEQSIACTQPVPLYQKFAFCDIVCWRAPAILSGQMWALPYAWGTFILLSHHR